MINVTESGTNSGKLWSYLRSIGIDLGGNRKISSKLRRGLFICMVCLRLIFDRLIFEFFDESGMTRKQRKLRLRYTIMICYPNFRSACKPALKNGHFMSKLNWHYIFRVELAG